MISGWEICLSCAVHVDVAHNWNVDPRHSAAHKSRAWQPTLRRLAQIEGGATFRLEEHTMLRSAWTGGSGTFELQQQLFPGRLATSDAGRGPCATFASGHVVSSPAFRGSVLANRRLPAAVENSSLEAYFRGAGNVHVTRNFMVATRHCDTVPAMFFLVHNYSSYTVIRYAKRSVSG